MKMPQHEIVRPCGANDTWVYRRNIHRNCVLGEMFVYKFYDKQSRGGGGERSTHNCDGSNKPMARWEWAMTVNPFAVGGNVLSLYVYVGCARWFRTRMWKLEFNCFKRKFIKYDFLDLKANLHFLVLEPVEGLKFRLNLANFEVLVIIANVYFG